VVGKDCLLYTSLYLEIGMNGRLGSGVLGQSQAHRDHRKLPAAGHLDHVEVAIAVPRFERFHGNRDQEIALTDAGTRRWILEFFQLGQVGLPDIALKRDIDEPAAPGGLNETGRFQLLQVVGERGRGNGKGGSKIGARHTGRRRDVLEDLVAPRVGKDAADGAHFTRGRCGRPNGLGASGHE